MMINGSSFESPKPYLFAFYLKNIIVALLRYLILSQTNTICVVLRGRPHMISDFWVGRFLTIGYNLCIISKKGFKLGKKSDMGR